MNFSYLKYISFEMLTNLGDLPNGQYALSLIVKFDNNSLVCDNGRKIIIK